MARCSLPFPQHVFCSHMQCVQCINYNGDDGWPVGDQFVIHPSDDCKSLSDIRNEIAKRYVSLKNCQVYNI